MKDKSFITSHLLNRTDAYYHYGIKQKVDAPIDDFLIEQHISGAITIGAYTTSLTQKCKWCCWDFDNHDGKGDTAKNFDAAVALCQHLETNGFYPVLEDSNGNGGYHIWCIFDEPVNSWDAYNWSHSIPVEGNPEVFPKQAKVTRYGNLVRLPGKHPTHNHTSTFWEGENQWVEDTTWELSPHELVPITPEPVHTVRGHRKASKLETSPALWALDRIGKEHADDYWDWLKVGFVLYSLDTSGDMLTRWDTWSKKSPKYKQGECAKKWDTFATTESERPATVAALMSWADEAVSESPQSTANGKATLSLPWDLKGRTAYEIASLNLPPIHWIAKDILPEGLTLFGGQPKTGKSWFVLSLCLSVASGSQAIGKYRTERGNVLYLALEDNDRRINQRLGISWKGKPIPKNLHIVCNSPRLAEGGSLGIETYINQHPETKLVVVDTLGMVRQTQTTKLNIYDQDIESLKPLRTIAQEHGIAIVVVHHLSKVVAEDPFMTFSGTQGLSGTADTLWILRKGRGFDNEFLAKGRDIEPVEIAMSMVSGNYTVLGDSDDFNHRGLGAEVLQVLKEATEPLKVAEIKELIDSQTTTKSLDNVIRKLRKKGDIENVKHGVYRYKGNILKRLSNEYDVAL